MERLAVPDDEFLRNWVAAQEWFSGERTAVMTAGSVNDLQPHERLPGDADIDLWVFHGEGVELPAQEKSLVGGYAFETDHFPLAELKRGAAVAGDFRLAPNLLSPRILFDPQGVIADAVARVSRVYREPRYLAMRTDAICAESRSHLGEYVASTTSTLDLLLGVLGLPNILLVAACRRPTFRRAFTHARMLCLEQGESGLYEAMLDHIGIGRLERAVALEMRDLCLRILDAAVAVRRTPFWGDFEIQPFRIRSFADFTARSIEDGLHREVAICILFTAYWGMLPFWMDRWEEERVEQQRSYDAISGGVGWRDADERRHCAARLLTFLETRLRPQIDGGD